MESERFSPIGVKHRFGEALQPAETQAINSKVARAG
jgi:hypothetical protein